MQKTSKLTMRLEPPLREKIDRYAKLWQVPVSDVVRRLLKHAVAGLEQMEKSEKAKK